MAEQAIRVPPAIEEEATQAAGYAQASQVSGDIGQLSIGRLM
jgi:hypothetical protein